MFVLHCRDENIIICYLFTSIPSSILGNTEEFPFGFKFCNLAEHWLTLNKPFCSRDIESRVQDSRRVCSAIIPNEVELTPCCCKLVSARTGVDWHSSTCDMAAIPLTLKTCTGNTQTKKKKTKTHYNVSCIINILFIPHLLFFPF